MTQELAENDAPRGIFITFEGGEGAGKTTHIRFLSEKLCERGREVVRLREPGGTAVGEELRAVVLDPKNDNLSDEAELLIYEAARAQIVAEVIRPALERGAVVLCDRFADSTIAYQVHGRGLDAAFVEQANAFACQGISPDRTILLTTGGSARTGLSRATHRGADRLERAGEEFHTRVNEGFLDIARAHADRVRVVQSAARKSRTSELVFRELAVTSMRLVVSRESGVVVAANMLGKIKTVSQFVCIIVVLLEPIVFPTGGFLSLFSMVIMVVFTIWSGVHYIRQYWNFLDPSV